MQLHLELYFLVLNLVSNAAPHFPLDPKEGLLMQLLTLTHTLLTKQYINSYFTSPIPCECSKASILKVKHLSKSSFPKILSAPSVESHVEPSASKNEHTMKKEFNVSTIHFF